MEDLSRECAVTVAHCESVARDDENLLQSHMAERFHLSPLLSKAGGSAEVFLAFDSTELFFSMDLAC